MLKFNFRAFRLQLGEMKLNELINPSKSALIAVSVCCWVRLSSISPQNSKKMKYFQKKIDIFKTPKKIIYFLQKSKKIEIFSKIQKKSYIFYKIQKNWKIPHKTLKNLNILKIQKYFHFYFEALLIKTCAPWSKIKQTLSNDKGPSAWYNNFFLFL